LNIKINFFVDFFGDFGLQDTFPERMAPKSIEIDKNKLRIKFSALNVDFDGLSLDFLRSGKLAHKMAGDRRRKPAYEIFSMECRF